MNNVSKIGIQLRQHRKSRGLSQLELAHDAGSTPRHISFIETGRSRPGRNLVLRLADALNLTLRESNDLLDASGLPLAFSDKPLDDPELKSLRRVIDKVLAKHHPFPAWVIGPGLRFLASNQAAEKLFPGIVGSPPSALIDVWCAPQQGVSEEQRAYIVHQTLGGLRRELFHHPHPDLPELIRKVEAYAVHIDEPDGFRESSIEGQSIFIDGQEVKTISTVMRFDKVINVTMSEVRIELIFPADEESEQLMRAAFES